MTGDRTVGQIAERTERQHDTQIDGEKETAGQTLTQTEKLTDRQRVVQRAP